MELLYGSIQLPYGSIWLRYGTCGSHTACTTPIWPHLKAMQLLHGAIRLPYGTIWLPHDSHMSHMAPAWCTWLPYGPLTVDVAPIWHHLHQIWCTHHPYRHTALLWSSYVTCGSHIVPYDSHSCRQVRLVHVALITAYTTPVWCHPPSKWWNLAPIWLQSSARGFQMAHTPPKCPHPPIWLPYRRAAHIPAHSSLYCNCMY
jgi:hypothetical protein